jgi:hypothetical protein
MNRKNIFRGKNFEGKWVEGDLIKKNIIATGEINIEIDSDYWANSYGYPPSDENFHLTNIEDVDNKTVGQLLFIINGHRFFEGDIIGRDESNAKYVILWNEENQCFSSFNCYDLKNINEGDELLKLNTLCNMEQVRVSFIKKYNFYPIGNIFDNPEMMAAAN